MRLFKVSVGSIPAPRKKGYGRKLPDPERCYSVITGFVSSDAEAVLVYATEYSSPQSLQATLLKSVQRLCAPVDVVKRGDYVYLVRQAAENNKGEVNDERRESFGL